MKEIKLGASVNTLDGLGKLMSVEKDIAKVRLDKNHSFSSYSFVDISYVEEPEIEREFKLWVLANRKIITFEEFEKIVGTTFSLFTKEHHKRCLQAWYTYLKTQKKDSRAKKQRKTQPVPIPCHFSQEGLVELKPKGGQREGMMIRRTKEGNLYVKWNDRKTGGEYHPSFIELLPPNSN